MRQKILVLFLIIALLAPFYPAEAIEVPGLAFGGKIVYSHYATCWIAGVVPVPTQIIVVQRGPITITLAYILYGPLLERFGMPVIKTYLWYRLWPAGAQALGKYTPVPRIPWAVNPYAAIAGQDGSQCVAVFYRTTNIITKIGTSAL